MQGSRRGGRGGGGERRDGGETLQRAGVGHTDRSDSAERDTDAQACGSCTSACSACDVRGMLVSTCCESRKCSTRHSNSSGSCSSSELTDMLQRRSRHGAAAAACERGMQLQEVEVALVDAEGCGGG